MKTLHPYQEEGAAWLASRGVMLADEPGLGKTLQAIEACGLVGARRVLVVCPAVALAVWRDEIRDSWPGCHVSYLRDLVDCGARKARVHLVEPSVIITGYEYLLVNDVAKQILAGIGHFDVLICDEAHALKNPTAKRTMLIYGPGCAGGGLASMARHVWLLTGTPQLNHPGEWFPHLRCLGADRIAERSYAGFVDHYCTKKVRSVRTKRGTKQIETIEGSNRAALPDLARRLRGFWLKRRQVDVLGQLPPLTISQRSVDPELCDAAILAQVEDSDEAQVLRRALEQGSVDALREVEGHVSKLRRLLSLAKVRATVAWVEDLLDQGAPAVAVFGWHTDALHRIRDALDAVMIDGGTPSKKRDAAVQAFQNGKTRVFVGQIQAAGTAITLTASNRVVMHEMAFTPALNIQAIKRCHRLGTQSAVLAEVLSVEGSLDYAVNAILARKSAEIKLLEDDDEA